MGMKASRYTDWGVAIALGVAAIQSAASGAWLAAAFFLVVLGGVAVGRYWAARNVFARQLVVFPEDGRGLDFFRLKLQEACIHGADVFSTYLLEEGHTLDEVTTQVQSQFDVEPTRDRVLKYTRMILIDDPTKERQWVARYLSLAKRGQSHGLSVVPSVLLLSSADRPLHRFIRSVVTRASLTLVRRNGREPPLVYLSIGGMTSLKGEAFSPNLGIAVRSEVAYNAAQDLVQWIERVGQATRVTTLAEYDEVRPSSETAALRDRVISRLREFAMHDKRVLHVGLFGRLGNQEVLPSAAQLPGSEHESDVDALVVIPEDADMREFKEALSVALESEVDRERKGETLELEWSRDRESFYAFRRPLHVDIQLHHRRDKYYVSTTKLLGYAVFYSGYQPLFSRDNGHIGDLLSIPRDLLGLQQRVRLALYDELGIDAFLVSCRGPISARIDPRRVVAIAVLNVAWAASGMRARLPGDAIAFLKASPSACGLHPQEMAEAISKVQSVLAVQSTEEAERRQPELLTISADVLLRFKVGLESLL